MRIFVLSIFSIIIVSCIKTLDIRPSYNDKVVINCILTNDSIQRLSITKSVYISDSYVFKEIRDVNINLYENGIIIGKFERRGYDDWQLKFSPVTGAEYSLEAILNDGSVITASTKMPGRSQINPVSGSATGISRYFRQYSSTNPIWIYVLSTNQNPVYKPSSEDILLKKIGTNHIHADLFSKIGSLSVYVNGGDTPAFEKYIRINDYLLEPDAYTDFCIQASYSNNGFIVIRTASSEYDKYLKSSIEKLMISESDIDPAQWFDEEPIFSNIVNGVGIFGAYYEQFYITRSYGL